jgi:photosynthetic reaction center cytochrome c subunit
MTNCAIEPRRASVAGPVKIVLALLGIAGVALTASRPAAAQQAVQEPQKPPVGTQGRAPAQPQEQLAAWNDTRPAEQVYKNVQVLKEMPADQFVRTMKGYTNALGVRCEFCHVTAQGSDIPGFGAFSQDDLETKRTARKMILMVGDIREKYFGDKQAPTCWTCHRGNKQPEFVPPPKPAPAAASPPEHK